MAAKKTKSNKKAGSVKYAEVWGILLIALAFFLFFALKAYDHSGNPLMTTSADRGASAGFVGTVISYLLFLGFGMASFALPASSFGFGIALLLRRPMQRIWLKLLYIALILITLCCILELQQPFSFNKNFTFISNGGIIGSILAGSGSPQGVLLKYLGRSGTSITVVAGFMISTILVTRIEILPYLKLLARGVAKLSVLIFVLIRAIFTRKLKPVKIVKPEKENKKPENKKQKKDKPKPEVIHQPPKRKIVIAEPAKPAAPKPQKEDTIKPKKPIGNYVLPSLDLLNDPPEIPPEAFNEDLNANSEILEKTLRNFGIEATVGEIHRGPVITRYEVHLAPGIKVQKVIALADDIAMSMKSHGGVRIVAPIPGKSAIGIEIPNATPTLVSLKEILTSKEFNKSKAKIPVGIGKSIDGKVVISDLTEMPHLLIAGATGAGKSVCINTVIMTLLYKKKPEELRLLLIDPKKVELSEYNRLPHLLVPVVTNVKKVAVGLKWVVTEMEKRYDYLSHVGARNIVAFNSRPIDPKQDTKALNDQDEEMEIPDRLPYIIVIIDELADLMMISPVDIESAIMRLAQLSRAVGIHLILATQRPSVNVITGVIKANFPARISFQVASKVDSRTVLDSNGAETLVGNGDLLFLPPTTSQLTRAQGTFVDDKEIKRVLDFIKKQADPEYNTRILVDEEQVKKPGDLIEDALFEDAVEVVLQTRQASASNLQRRMRIGYARAARIIDMMEDRGIIGPSQGSRAREIFIRDVTDVGSTGNY
jgi:DNA segregation ATPase FtsK/SpoIIIE, S-DNA-T family